MKARSLLAAAVAVASAAALGVSGSASATTMSQHGSTPGTHTAEIRGFRPALGIHVPSSRLPHLTPKATSLSTNWSGYTALADKNVAVRFVDADWNVPSINPAQCVPGTSGFAYAIHWVGLDGFGSTPNGSSTTVEQVGTGAYCQSGGTISYYAFYEMYPTAPVVFTGINPGDAITASVYYNSTSNEYNLVLNDVTTDSQINVDQACPSGSTCKNSSAEVITEVTGGGPPLVNLADFGMVNVTGASVTSRGGLRGNLGASKYWTSSQIDMVNGSGGRMATASALYGGQAFNVTWNASS